MTSRMSPSCLATAELASLKQSSRRGHDKPIRLISFFKACPPAEPASSRNFLLQSEGLLLGAGVLNKTEE